MLKKINIFLIVGIFIFIGALALGGYLWHVRTVGITTQGKVVKIASYRGTKSEYIYTPIVDFTLPDGKTVEIRSPFSSSENNHYVNQIVDIIYDPSNPKSAILSDDASGFIPMGIMLLMGIAFTFVGLILYGRDGT